MSNIAIATRTWPRSATIWPTSSCGGCRYSTVTSGWSASWRWEISPPPAKMNAPARRWPGFPSRAAMAGCKRQRERQSPEAEASGLVQDQDFFFLRPPFFFFFLPPFFFFGTFLPFLRASDRPMAIACLRLFTLPPLPLFSVPFFLRRTALSTSLLALLEYFRAMV